MPPTIAIPVEEYLNTSYQPDRDYLDGEVVERNLGSQQHSLLQAIVLEHLRRYRKEFRIQPLPECRLRVTATRYRVPDITVLGIPYSKGNVITDVPLAVIEILSPDDRLKSVLRLLNEYEQLGVNQIVLLDPEDRRAYVYTEGALQEAGVRTLRLNAPGRVPPDELPFSSEELFALLDE